ncbi:MAG: hypothetical protein U0163_05230 [Gemmatimonadaceae bacterium]
MERIIGRQGVARGELREAGGLVMLLLISWATPPANRPSPSSLGLDELLQPQPLGQFLRQLCGSLLHALLECHAGVLQLVRALVDQAGELRPRRTSERCLARETRKTVSTVSSSNTGMNHGARQRARDLESYGLGRE